MSNMISQQVIFADNITVVYPPHENALLAWVDATTDPISDRRQDLLRDKIKAASDFFDWICKPVHEITPNDVKSWQFQLEQRNLAPCNGLWQDEPNLNLLRVADVLRVFRFW